VNAADLRWILPEILLAALAVVLLVAELFTPRENKRLIGALSLAGLAPVGFAILGLLGNVGSLGSGVRIFGDTYTVDAFALYFKLIAVLAAALIILVSLDYFPGRTTHVNETYVMILFTTFGLMLMASASELVTLLIGIEFVSLTSYLLAGYLKTNAKSNEAGVKYFLYGAATTGVMVYGLSLLFGLSGTTSLYEIGGKLARGGALSFVAVAMTLAGLGFKISMAPFHQWTPDVYEGAPTPVTAFFSVGPKAAGFALLVRVLTTAVPADAVPWPALLAGLSALTMTVGNLFALQQRNIKRMLAYSSISHAGYMLMAVVAWPSAWAQSGLLVYVLAYLFTNVGAFTAAIVASTNVQSDDIPDYAGLSQRSAFTAAAMTLFLLSLTGVPPTAGFFGKFYLFAGAIDGGYLWLAGVAAVNSVISLYYYVGVVRAMYLMPAKVTSPLVEPATLRIGLWVTAAATLVIGILPQPLLLFVETAKKLIAGN
jgi:NADH-quinone oxidoreductase subunit N